jgi:hypothetical protein
MYCTITTGMSHSISPNIADRFLAAVAEATQALVATPRAGSPKSLDNP